MASSHMKINSREELMEYGLRALGSPVIQINVDQSQLQDRIDDALDLFWEYHNEGTELVFVSRQITQEDKDRGYIELPDNIQAVLNVLMVDGGGSTGIATVNLSYQVFLTDIMNATRLTRGGLGDYYLSQSWLSTINQTFNTRKRLAFNWHHHRLTIQGNWSEIGVGDWLAVECYRIIHPGEVGGVYNDRWLKKYVVAQFKKQWGDNLIKYGGAQLPGGVTINAEQIYNDGRADCKELEDELKNDYQLPVDFYMG